MSSFWIAFGVGIVMGVVIGWLLRSLRSQDGGATAELVGKAAAAEAKALELERQKNEHTKNIENIQGQLREAEKSLAALHSELGQKEKNLAEQRQLLDEAQAKFEKAFELAAAKALRDNNEGFVKAAVKPIEEQLTRFKDATEQLESKRNQAIGRIDEQLRNLNTAHNELHSETTKLVNALSAPQVKGAWGEITLRRCAELAGMSDHVDFSEQVSTITNDGRLRPDMIVSLPGGRKVIVDSKVPLTAYLEAMNSPNAEARVAALQRHAKLVRDHVNGLSSKEYPKHFPGSLDFVLLFIPSESFFAAAADQDTALIESAAQQDVVIVSPTTLIAMLRAIALGWEDQKRHENARQIFVQAQELVERIQVWLKHMGDLRKGLIAAVEAHDRAVGSLDSRVLPAARKLKELDAGIKQELSEVEPIGRSPRALNPSEE